MGLLMTILVIALPIMGLFIATSIEQYHLAQANLANETKQLTRITVNQQKQLFKNTRGTLISISEQFINNEYTLSECQHFLNDLLVRFPQFADLAIVNLDGELNCSARTDSKQLNFADQSWFQLAAQSQDFVVGNYQHGSSAGRSMLTVAHPVLNHQNQAQFYMVGFLDLDWINQLASQANLPEKTTITLIDNKGIIFARYPNPQKFIGKFYHQTGLLKLANEKYQGNAEATGVDGIQRFYNFELLPYSQSAFIFVGIPSAEVTQPITNRLIRDLLGLVIVSILSLTLAIYAGNRMFISRIENVAAAAKKLAGGDLNVRVQLPSNTSEIYTLAYSFNDMAAQLQKQQMENEGFVTALQNSEERFRLLFEQLTVGFALHEVILDDQGVPVDYRFLEINPAFEKLTGLRKEEIVGKTVLEIMPTTEKYWIDTYGQVALSGVPRQIENYSGELNRHYSVNAYSPKFGQFAVLVKDVTDQKQAEEILRQNIHLSEIHIKRLNNLRRIDLAITQCDDYEIMLNEILTAVRDSLGVEVADILLTDDKHDMFQLAAIKGVENEDVLCSEFPATDSCLSLVLQNLETILSHEHGSEHVTRRFRKKFDFHGMTPLIAKGELKGILEIYHPDTLELEEGWKEFFYALGLQAAIAIDNIDLQARRQQANFELIQAYDETIAGWSHALDLRDHETEGHSQRVTEMTLLLAREMDYPENAMEHIRRGALLHDIGKVGIPDSILLKPGPLNADEWEIMRRHPGYARDLMTPISFLHPAMDIPYCHHEKWDGSGYPRGLKGEEIPLAARIFAVVDVWDALQSDRPYRKGWQNEAIHAYIQDQSGSHFDPQIVAVFIRHYDRITRPLHSSS